VSKSKGSDRSSLDIRTQEHSHDTQPRRMAEAVGITKFGESDEMQDAKKFSKRILTIHEERAERYGFVTVGFWMR
jgi:hypothetical protein